MYVTLNISATSVRLLSVKGRRIQEWGEAPLSPGLVSDGLVLQPEAVGEAVDALFKSLKVPKQKVITTVTGLSFTHRVLSLPRMKPALLEEAILRGAKQEIPLPLEELYLTWQAVESRGDEMDYFILGVPRNLVDALVQTLEEAGVEPYIMGLKPLALARAAGRENALIVGLETDCFDIVLVADGVPAILHTIAPRGEWASLEDNVLRLTDELSRAVKFYNTTHLESSISSATPLLLTGELAADATAGKLIQAEVEYPVEPLIPPLEIPADLPPALYAANMGLALKKMPREGDTAHFHDVNLNILSGKYKPGRRPVSLRSVLASLALVVVIGLVSPLYLVKGEADAETVRLQAELNRLGQEIRQTRLNIEEAGQIEDAISEIEVGVESLRQGYQNILNQGRDLAGKLASVRDALPSGAYFTSIETVADQITVSGEADNAFVVVSYAQALEAQGVFSEVRIGEIDESAGAETAGDGSFPVSFTIVVSR